MQCKNILTIVGYVSFENSFSKVVAELKDQCKANIIHLNEESRRIVFKIQSKKLLDKNCKNTIEELSSKRVEANLVCKTSKNTLKLILEKLKQLKFKLYRKEKGNYLIGILCNRVVLIEIRDSGRITIKIGKKTSSKILSTTPLPSQWELSFDEVEHAFSECKSKILSMLEVKKL